MDEMHKAIDDIMRPALEEIQQESWRQGFKAGAASWGRVYKLFLVTITLAFLALGAGGVLVGLAAYDDLRTPPPVVGAGYPRP